MEHTIDCDLIAFNHPPDEQLAEASRRQKASALQVATLQCCPDVDTNAEGIVTKAEIMRAGVHAYAVGICNTFMTQQALPQIVGAAMEQMAMRVDRCHD